MAAPRPEVINRFLFAKSLLLQAERDCGNQLDNFIFSRGLLLLHDSAEAALGAVADHLHAQLNPSTFLLNYYDKIQEADKNQRTVPYRTQMRNLGSIRNDIKHKGIFPDIKANTYLPRITRELLSETCTTYLGLDFESLSLKSMIANPSVSQYIAEAEQALEDSRYEHVFVNCAYAMYYLAEFETIEHVGIERKKKYLETRPFQESFLIRLLQNGVNPSDYAQFKLVTPKIYFDSENQAAVYVWDKYYGHPANWTESNAKRCLTFSIDCAVRFSNVTSFYDYDLTVYSDVYHDTVEALSDNVIIWNAPSWFEQRDPVYVLSKGITINGQVSSQDDPNYEFNELQILNPEWPTQPSKHESLLGYFVAKEAVKVKRLMSKPESISSENTL